MNNTAVIYARVLSIGERQSNERQIEDLKILGKQRNYKIEKIYEEKISGAKRNAERQVLTECLEYCFSKNVKILLISELSRLGRKTGYRKSKEEKAEQYAGVIKLLKKGYPVRNIAKIESVGISTVMRL